LEWFAFVFYCWQFRIPFQSHPFEPPYGCPPKVDNLAKTDFSLRRGGGWIGDIKRESKIANTQIENQIFILSLKITQNPNFSILPLVFRSFNSLPQKI
jgi:hypothetical protein